MSDVSKQGASVIAWQELAAHPALQALLLTGQIPAEFLASGGGDISNAANTGTGAGLIFRDKTGATLNFRSIEAGIGILVQTLGSNVKISASGGGAQINTTVAPATTAPVDTLVLTDTRSAKWFIAITDTVNGKTFNAELNTHNHNDTSLDDTEPMFVLRDLFSVTVAPVIVGPTIELQVNNTGPNPVLASIVRLAIVTK